MPAQRLSGWTEDLARAISADDLRKLNAGILDNMDAVAKAHEALNQFEEDLNALDARKAEVAQEFGPPFFAGFMPVPNWPALVALAPLLSAQSYLKVGGRRLAAIDVLFSELSLSYAGMGNAFDRAGFAIEARNVRTAGRLMREWHASFEARILGRMPSIMDDRQAIDGNFDAALQAHGLRRILDDEKPGYFDVLAEVLRSYTEEPAPEEAKAMKGSPLGVVDPVSITLIILGLIKVIVIVVAIVAVVALISNAVKSIYGASEEAMGAARELQHRKTLREQQVLEQVQANERAVEAGTMTREQADDRNKEARAEAAQENETDGQSFKKDVEAAADAAAKARPGIGDILLWVGLPVLGLGAAAIGLKVAGVL